MDGQEGRLVAVTHTRANATNERRQTCHRCDRIERSNGQLNTRRVFDGKDDEHNVERLQVEIASQMMKRIDRFVIDPEMMRNGASDEFVEVLHGPAFS